MQTVPGSDRKLPPPATVNLSGMGNHTFLSKVKDSCVRCKGNGENMGLVCALCNGSGMDEVGNKELVTKTAFTATSSPGAGSGAVAGVGAPGSQSPAHPPKVVSSNVGGGGPAAGGGGGCCVLS